ncbi:MAG: hypothetical protein V5A23_01575 [Halobacteriales archaeon]
MVDGSGGSDGAMFAQALSALKERGSNLLVVGGANREVHLRACDRLLGEDDTQPRRRVFVRTDGTACCDPEAHGGSAARKRVVDHAATTRSAAAQAAPASRPVDAGGDSDPGELASSIRSAIGELEPGGGYDPAELRVCFDSLLPLLSDHDEETVFRMLNLVTSEVRSASGMAHFHLPVAASDHAVVLLEPMFDAVISVRMRDGTPQHNWRLVEREIESGWLPL